MIIVQSIKHHFISKFPPYLIVSVKRFEYDVGAKCNRKNAAVIPIGPIMEIRGVEYQIASVIVHRVAIS